jgi:hypothetical protein
VQVASWRYGSFAVVAGMGLFALFDPGSIRVVVTAGL